ncbi:SprT family protein [Bacillus benzoevorans]|uniref:Protein SprT-like n=1 Tax=Bacillus benzoevorans TaxID=1456 RepID=A0A7X0HX95_9BACI|nr:SprT family protein [Bacillus benzoevorans]MBB6447662.1 SprT-like protein [Bacillus benzoevorans]
MDNDELQRLVEEISNTFFEKPFRHQAIFNPRLRTTGGRYLLKSHNIEMNKKYLEQLGREELIGIIKHELCHYHLHLEGHGYKHGDQDFKWLLHKVGAPRYCSTLPETMEKRRIQRSLTYLCTECSQVYKRKRKLDTKKYVCGRCRGKLALAGE